MTNLQIVQLLNDLLGETVGNADEDAIIRLLRTIRDAGECDRLRVIVNEVGLPRLGRKIDGAQEDELRSVLQSCDIPIFFSDREAREFVNSASCDDLRSQSDETLVVLISTLAWKDTGNRDEEAIIALLLCLEPDCDRIRQIVERVGISVFARKVQGRQRDQLELIFRGCGIVGL